MLVKALVRRNLKETEGFSLQDPDAEVPTDSPDLNAGESIIGRYTNPPPYASTLVYFTTKAIVVVGPTQTLRLPLGKIVAWRTTEAKADVSGVTVDVEGESHFIPFAGRRGPGGKFIYAYSLGTMLNVVVNASPAAFPE